jgi:MFS family permease
MVKSFLHKLLLRRHFWRYATFSEVAELYTSRVLRLAAVHIVGGFMSVYLYQLGYSVTFIALAWGCFYALKVFTALPSAALVARIGPKHGILLANILYIPAMICFALLPEYGAWLLVPTLVFQALSIDIYAVAYNVDFSKVKSTEHAGKEIAYMNIFEKITAGLSPLIGGFIAFFFGPQVVMVVAAILFAVAAAPLFKSGEPVHTGRKLQFKGFPWRLFFKQSAAQWSIGFDVFASGIAWSLYTAVIILGVGEEDDIYAQLGALVSVVFLAALVASYTFGRLIDRRRGKDLMQLGAVANSVTHLMRPFINTPVAVAGLNAANEVATTAYTMPYTRAVFDNADLSGTRTTYLGLVEMFSNFGAACAAFTLAGVAYFFGDTVSLSNFFFFAAAVALVVLSARFPLYKR